MHRRIAVLLVCSTLAAGSLSAQEYQSILLDTDLGTDPGAPFALGLILTSKYLDLQGVTTVGSDPEVRALMACRFLTMTGRRRIAVGAGAAPQPKLPIPKNGAYRYYYHPDVLFNRTTRPVKEGALGLLQARLKAQPGKVTLIAAGPLTNIARLLTEVPESRKWIRRIVLVGGAPTADGKGEANFAADPAAARKVLTADLPLVILPSRVTERLKLEERDARRVFEPATSLTLQMEALHQLSDAGPPSLGDTLAVAVCLDESYAKLEPRAVTVQDDGTLVDTAGSPNARVAQDADPPRFLNWFVGSFARCISPEKTPAKVVSIGGLPHRVHVAEDFDTDIERFWWMSGKEETKNLPPGSRRACRGTLTHDFDDLLGHSRAMYTAVIFNPVPGPPMGEHTRLAFRYFLRGTDRIRVQIYSLTNGYHRQLYLEKQPQGRWLHVAVDLTEARRPDGTGGPLSKDERIDDIQFYTDPHAELLIDDVILYDASPPLERQSFPKKIVFAGGFDTGQQGKHWPGDFELVKEGYFWRSVRSVPHPGTKAPWIRLGLRGERPVGTKTNLTFRYSLAGAKNFRVELVGTKTSVTRTAMVQADGKGWHRATVRLPAGKNEPAMPRVDEIRFHPPAGSDLLIDDLLLWE